MTRAGVPEATKQAMWKAYKKHQTAFYVARVANVSPHTAAKYIHSGKFSIRFSKLKVKASAIADDAQADALADDLITLGNIKTLLTDKILTSLKKGTLKPSITELDRVVRLIAFIRGEPDQRSEELYDFSWIEELEAVEGEREREEQKALESDT
ncbi:hypothetical protein [ANMV-1 virus]|nr:hypothetical protein [ANMV-1 virus]